MRQPLTDQQTAFLVAYRTNGLVKPAAAQAKCSRELHYGALRSSETYRRAFAMVQSDVAEELEEEARQRAIYGVKIPKFYRGKVIGYETRYSDMLLMVLLEANAPEKFGGIREELQEQDRDAGFCDRWDRDEVARPTLPRMTGPQPPMPPRPPRPPLPPVGECSEPVEYAEWTAARGIGETAACTPLDQEKLDRWATSKDLGPVEWVPEELASDDVEVDPIEEMDPGSDDSDVDFCVRLTLGDEDVGLLASGGPAPLGVPAPHPWSKEGRATFGHAFHRQRRGGNDVGFGVRRRATDGLGWETSWPFQPEKRPERGGGRGAEVSLWQRTNGRTGRNTQRCLHGSLSRSASGEGRGPPLHPNRRRATPPPEHRSLASQPP